MIRPGYGGIHRAHGCGGYAFASHLAECGNGKPGIIEGVSGKTIQADDDNSRGGGGSLVLGMNTSLTDS